MTSKRFIKKPLELNDIDNVDPGMYFLLMKCMSADWVILGMGNLRSPGRFAQSPVKQTPKNENIFNSERATFPPAAVFLVGIPPICVLGDSGVVVVRSGDCPKHDRSLQGARGAVPVSPAP
uniref:Uncharacterized protein n=1 Tax=Steinernema glaseri TaxID=37863 RepID=A0A1I7Y7G7_9BILA